MKLIFERGAEGRGLSLLPACDVPRFLRMSCSGITPRFASRSMVSTTDFIP